MMPCKIIVIKGSAILTKSEGLAKHEWNSVAARLPVPRECGATAQRLESANGKPRKGNPFRYEAWHGTSCPRLLGISFCRPGRMAVREAGLVGVRIASFLPMRSGMIMVAVSFQDPQGLLDSYDVRAQR